MQTNEIYHGDCLDLMNQIEDKSIDFIFADLPYGITANKWDSVIPLNQLWEQYNRIIKPKGNIVLFGSGLFAHKLALSNEKRFRYDLVWKKSKCGSPFTAKYMPLKTHEYLLVFGEGGNKYNPQMVPGMPYKRVSKKGKNNMEYSAKAGFEYGSKDGLRHPNTILDFPQKWRRQDQIHPTQKPLELIEWCIKTFSDENDIVLDNVCGSGTVGIGCQNLNRQYILIEKEEKYYNIALNRLLNNKI